MSLERKKLIISTRTTGFASPAESYVDSRLDLNDLLIKDLKTTFYFKYKGPNTLGVKRNSVLIVDRSVPPKEGDLVVLTDKTFLKIREYKNQENLWGKVTWVLEQK